MNLERLVHSWSKALCIALIGLLAGCGFSKDYTSSSPTIGERLRGPMRIIRLPEMALYLDPRNSITTFELDYFVIIPYRWDNEEKPYELAENGEFKIGVAAFSYHDDVALDLAASTLILNGQKHTLLRVDRYFFANRQLSQARKLGDREPLCPMQQETVFDGSLPNGAVPLRDNGVWECFDLVFPVDTPSPHQDIALRLTFGRGTKEDRRSITITFEASDWGRSDSIP